MSSGYLHCGQGQYIHVEIWSETSAVMWRSCQSIEGMLGHKTRLCASKQHHSRSFTALNRCSAVWDIITSPLARPGDICYPHTVPYCTHTHGWTQCWAGVQIIVNDDFFLKASFAAVRRIEILKSTDMNLTSYVELTEGVLSDWTDDFFLIEGEIWAIFRDIRDQ